MIDGDGYGFYLRAPKGKKQVWFGVDYAFWKAMGYPLSIASELPSRKACFRTRRMLERSRKRYSGFIYRFMGGSAWAPEPAFRIR